MKHTAAITVVGSAVLILAWTIWRDRRNLAVNRADTIAYTTLLTVGAVSLAALVI